MTISLSDLKAKRAAMTPGEWMTDSRFGPARIKAGSLDEVDGVGQVRRDPDAFGIVATHNAADVLIEIAEAARDVAALHREAVDGFDDDGHADRWRDDMDRAEQRLDAALDKITT